MSEPTLPKPPARPISPLTNVKPVADPQIAGHAEDPVLCERCGAGMYRMHAVWRCPGCGFKTDCCGW
jgi:hypothetical protein